MRAQLVLDLHNFRLKMTFLLWVLGFLIKIKLTISATSNFNVDAEESDYGNVIISSAKFYVKYSCLVLISSNDKFKSDLHKYNGNYLRSSIILSSPLVEVELRNEAQMQFMIVHDVVEEIGDLLTNIRKFTKSNTRFVIIMTKNNCSESKTNHEYGRVFDVTWNLLRLKNVIIIEQGIRDGCDENKVVLFHPFLDRIQKFTTKQLPEIEKFLQFRNYHQETIKASLFESVPTTVKIGGVYMGIDPMVMQTLEKVLNVSIVHHEPYDGRQYGFRSKNGTLAGAIKELYTREVDIAFNQVFIKEYNAPELVFSKIIFQDRLCVIVPKAQPIPNWTAIFYTFPVQVWIGILLTISTAVLGLFVLRMCKITIDGGLRETKTKHSNDYRWGTVVLDVSQIFFSTAYSTLFSNKHYERIFLGATFLYVLTVNTLFQSSLVTVISNPRRYPDIDTLRDLAESGLYISTASPSIADTFNGTRNPYIQALNSRFEVVGQNQSYFNAYVSRESKQNYFDYLNKSHVPTTHTVRECPRTFLLSYLTFKDAYFQDDFDRTIGRIFASGLISKWYQTVKMNVSLILEKESVLGNASSFAPFPRPFSMKDLQTSFYILLAGLSTSFLFFCLEVNRWYVKLKNALRKKIRATL